MKKTALILLFYLFTVNSFSQAETSNWYFGSNAGIKFNLDGSIENLNDGKLNTVEGCATISDENGNLLFYTDGITVWNKQHLPMPNANGLTGNGLFGDPSSSQSAIVVPKPNDRNIYYIFTVDTSVRDTDPDRGFNYSTVDMTLDGGLGDVLPSSKNINLLQDSSEKITAVLKDCSTKSIWVLTLASSDGLPSDSPNFNTFYAYEISNSGVNNTPVTSTLSIFSNDSRGYLKLSPDGKKMACANASSGLYLFDFDTTTGIVSNPYSITINFSPIDKPQSPYGVEFSQNNKLLYVSSYYNPRRSEANLIDSQYGALLQYDLTATNINDSEIVIDDRQLYRGALQLAPNGKIYRAMNRTYNLGSPFLSVINNPNEPGLNCDYQHNRVSLNNNSTQGLPPFISSFFAEKINISQNKIFTTYIPLCYGERYTLGTENTPNASYSWTLDNAAIPENNYSINVTTEGLYKLIVERNDGNCNVLEGEALVKFFTPPSANTINDILVCNDNDDNISSFDFSLLDNEILGSQNPVNYNVKYFTSQQDADLNQNEIVGEFKNSTNPQRIYTRIGLTGNTTCFDTSKSFLVEVFTKPIANPISSPLEICDLSSPSDLDTFNGKTEIDLNQFNTDILGNQDPNKFSISYYKSISDAETKNAPLSYLHYNQVAFNDTIYARIQNNANPNCFAISSAIHLIINPLPKTTDTTLTQCNQNDSFNSITTFNLLEPLDILTNYESNRSVVFFESLSDLENHTNIINNPDNYINKTSPQTIFVKVTNETSNCTNTAKLTLEVSSVFLDDFIYPICDELNSEDGLNTFNLDSITLDIQSEYGFTWPISYYKKVDDALLKQNEITSPYNNQTPYNENIFGRINNSLGCYSIIKIQLIIDKLPEIPLTQTTFYCTNFYPQKIILDSGINKSEIENYTYAWSNGSSDSEIQVNTIGTYDVTVTNLRTGCLKKSSITIEPSSDATINPFKVKDVSNNNSITVIVTGDGIYEYQLNNNKEVLRPYQSSNTFENVKPGVYKVFVKDIKNNCGITNDDVSVIGFPKFFTPNNDNFNDTWQLNGVSQSLQANSKILIYNRYGKLVKELDPLSKGWNGKFNGKMLPPDDYWFLIKLEDGRIYRDHFTLKL